MEVEGRVGALMARGDLAGAATLVIEGFGAAVFRYLCTLLDEDDAADAFSQWSEDVWRGLAAFRRECSLRAWAYRLAHNAHCRLRRDPYRARGQRLATSAASRLAASIATSTLSAGSRREGLRRVVAKLAADDQRLYALRIDGELEWEDIAAALSSEGPRVSAVALRQRFARLRARLVDLVHAEGLLDDVERELPSPAAEDPPAVAGRRVGRFELLRELGRGGFGRVFEARDVELGRRVALKLVKRRDASTDALLGREAKAVAQLSHPHIVTLFDWGSSEAGPFLVFELLHGETLDGRLTRGPLAPREAVRVALAVARSLVHAHAADILHRDLKPSNVFLTADGGVKVLDFGLAQVLGAVGPARSGTPGYMAPEQLRGEREDVRTDVFAVGVLLSETIGDRRGHAAESVLRVATRLRAEAPADRPPDAAAVARELVLLADALEPSVRRAGPIAGASESRSARAEEALRLGRECASRPVFGQDCSQHYRHAVELDPTLASAHYQLAVWTRRFGGSVAAQRRAIARAVRHHRHAPPAEQVLIRAFAAHVKGHDDDAIALFREATERWPEDKRAFYEIGDLLRHQDELELAIPYLERAVALDPGFGWAPGQLAEILGALGRDEALRGWIARWSRADTPVSLHALSIGHGWLGDFDAAAAAARRALELGAGLVAQQDLIGAIGFQGRVDDAERMARSFAEPGSPIRRMGFYALAAIEAYRGRRRAGLAWLDALEREIPDVLGDSLYFAVRADYLLGDGDPGPVLAEVARLERIDPRAAAEHAAGLAWLGADDDAARLAAGLRPGSALARTYEAVAAFREGQVDVALDLLRGVVAEAPISVWRVPPLWFQADLALAAGRPAEALAALERHARLYLPRVMWRSWTHPRSLLMIARCHEALGGAGRA